MMSSPASPAHRPPALSAAVRLARNRVLYRGARQASIDRLAPAPVAGAHASVALPGVVRPGYLALFHGCAKLRRESRRERDPPSE
jgi:hypothetical protein